MATFVVCLQCGKVRETAAADQLPKGWQRSHANLFCSHCADTNVLSAEAAGEILNEAAGEILNEDVIHPPEAAGEIEEVIQSPQNADEGH